MSTYISVYANNPTAGLTDGTVISENGSFTSPLSVTLNATNEEVKYIKCALRTISGYATTGDTTIAFAGSGDKTKWSLALDSDYTDETAKSATYTDTLTISDEINNTNKIFWVKVTSSKDETPANHNDVSIEVNATIKAVD